MPLQGDLFAEDRLETCNIHHQRPSSRVFQASVPTPSIASRSDALFHCASDTSHSDSTCASSTTANEIFNWNSYDLGDWVHVASSDMGWDLSGTGWQYWDSSQPSAAMDNIFDPANEALPESDEWEAQADNFWCTTNLCQGTDSTANYQALEDLNHTIPMWWHTDPYATSYSASGSSIYDTSLCELSPTPLSQGEQGSIRFRHDSVELCGAIVQPPSSFNMSTSMPQIHMSFTDFESSIYNPEACNVLGAMNSQSTRRLGLSTCRTEDVVRQDHERPDRCEQKSKKLCPYPECTEKFSYRSDLNRHVKTKHSETGNGYRCAFQGCPKAYKVWSRLDSFKKHAKYQHKVKKPADVQGLVKKSCTEHHGLPFSVTTPKMMTRNSFSISQA